MVSNNGVDDQAFGIVPILAAPGGSSPEVDAEKYLLIQHQAGHWGFPKGHAELGETPIESACREFEEETGIRAYRLIGTTSFSETYTVFKKSKTLRKTVTYFVALVNSAEVNYQADEIRDYAWLPFQAALEQITFVQSKQLLIQVNDYFRTNLGNLLNI
ncbi:bis(5'-nucleosyl)-tetraphosphatase [Leptolyngbya sp. 7M]|uniref:bis(5'-nucleosyl)-tetraphosphatase n=1 Tax=Leptolyngbya sp. 7M TaxID=2812896 RepID=UPI001B8B3C6A|nr:NUDIX domain-containing protein [Leptolyngbya sp. 7M]QYO62936.1 NUDIX domain-containing protein [Leptolyngbya sp. 7M]